MRLLAYEVGDGVSRVTECEDELGDEGVVYSSSSSDETDSSTSQKLKLAADIAATKATVGRYDTVLEDGGGRAERSTAVISCSS